MNKINNENSSSQSETKKKIKTTQIRREYTSAGT